MKIQQIDVDLSKTTETTKHKDYMGPATHKLQRHN